MKHFILLLLTTFTLSCCSNDEEQKTTSEIDKLPPATQTGANKVGCLLDGKAFLPGNFPNATNCFYQFVDGEYYFYLNFNNIISNKFLAISLGTEKKQIFQNQIYDLFERVENNAFGNYTFETLNYSTNTNYTGKLTITKLDPINFIVSGTFWFDVQDSNGIVHQIREGRFDMQYTN
jgi:hypothetical protein